MYLYHNSQNEKFRSPFGAAPTLSSVTLSIEARGARPVKMLLRLWRGENEKIVEMPLAANDGDSLIYSQTVQMPPESCLLWYFFIAEYENGVNVFYFNNAQSLGGEGEMSRTRLDRSFQITVYESGFKTPDWYKNAVMYQIFPDRFMPSEEPGQIVRRRDEYTIHEDWYEPIFFSKHPHEDGPACNDFFGGSLKGILSRLDYLTDLGISAIYLNPIFEAYSNHRYDTGNYEKIDPILGTEEDFKLLASECEKRGIRIILDGVFSHTGSDSIYFNKYGNYGENTGAYRDKNSPYRKWYEWCGEGSRDYKSWWGCSNLPNIIETEPTYIDYILTGKDAIIKKWLRCGASGWRLDVADELPDSFIKTLRSEMKAENENAVLIGEVWEDASNKVSYGQSREYLFGNELDAVMNYPFKDSVIAFLTGGINAENFKMHIMSIAENYPAEALYAAMNILGTHDTMRIKTVLGGVTSADGMDNHMKQYFRLSPKSETLALKRLGLAAFIQMTFVGVPCIYYGDEIGMQGLCDPFNRMPFTWRQQDVELRSFYKKLISLRNDNVCLRTGTFTPIYASGDLFVYLRSTLSGRSALGEHTAKQAMLCAVNRSNAACEVNLTALPHELISVLPNKDACGVLGNGKLAVCQSEIKLCLGAHGCEIFTL